MKDKLFKAIRGKCISDESARAVIEEVEKLYSAGEEVYVPCSQAEGDIQLPYRSGGIIALKRVTRPTVSEEEWISVEDQLPERECLCINRRNDILIGYLTKRGSKKYWCINDDTALTDVTHWRYLPSPPKPLRN